MVIIQESASVDSQFIIPFVESVNNVFETMLQLEVAVSPPSIRTDNTSQEISGIIGMSGDVEGTVVLGFPAATAERAVGAFTGMEIAADHEDFADAVGELVNMVSGGAKAKFTGKRVSIGCPSVVIGEHHVAGPKGIPTIHIPCSCDLGEFSVDVTLRAAAADQGAAA